MDPALPELEEYLKDLPDRFAAGYAQMLIDSLERLVVRLSSQTTWSAQGDQAPQLAALEPADVKKALKQLEQVRETLSKALRILADRRSPARIAITASDKPRKFLDLPDEQVFEMQLAHLWPGLWIRHDLRALSCGRLTCHAWSYLGIRAIGGGTGARAAGGEPLDLLDLPQGSPSVAADQPALECSPGARRIADRSRRAKPDRTSAWRSDHRLAVGHGIGDAVLEAKKRSVVPHREPSPFADQNLLNEQDILEWLQRVPNRRTYSPDALKGPEIMGIRRAARRTLLRSMGTAPC
jgi:hypothetical protein